MKLLLLGANGQVGFELRRACAPLGQLHALTRAELDLSHRNALASIIRTERPDVILNAAAWTQVDRAEDEPDAADAINHQAVATLGALAAESGALVVHYSTDYVFAGGLKRPYREDDPIGPSSAYGASKAAGEAALRFSGAAHLIFRTAWVYAARGQNFLRTMLKLAAERDRLRVVDDQIGSPTSARQIAAATALALQRWAHAPVRRGLEGTYHLSAADSVSWHGFACEILRRAVALKLLERAPPVDPVSSADYAARAPRPAHSVLDTQLFKRTFGLALPSWSVGLDQVLEELVR
jgi:dTDP-4-dehydrorhamnose reductase